MSKQRQGHRHEHMPPHDDTPDPFSLLVRELPRFNALLARIALALEAHDPHRVAFLTFWSYHDMDTNISILPPRTASEVSLTARNAAGRILDALPAGSSINFEVDDPSIASFTPLQSGLGGSVTALANGDTKVTATLNQEGLDPVTATLNVHVEIGPADDDVVVSLEFLELNAPATLTASEAVRQGVVEVGGTMTPQMVAANQVASWRNGKAYDAKGREIDPSTGYALGKA